MTRTTLFALVALSLGTVAAACDGGPLAPEGGAVDRVEITPESPQMETGGSLQLTATLRDAEGNALDGREVFWSSEDEGVARVSATGMLTGGTEGTTRVAASAEGRSAVATVVVGPPSVASVVVAPARARLPVRATLQLQAIPYDLSGRALAGRSVAWSSSDPATVAVDGAGVITALRPGTATITASSAGQVGRSEITVIVGAPTRVVAAGGEAQTGTASAALPAPLAVRVTDADGNPIGGVPVAWTVASGSGSIRVVTAATDASGISTAEWTLGPTAGMQTARAEVAGLAAVVFSASAQPGSVATVTVAPDGVTLASLGDTRQYTAIARDAAGNVVAGLTFAWSSSAPAVANVTQAGLATATGNGATTIAAEAGGVRGTATLTVAQQVARVVVDPATLAVEAGSTGRLSALPVDDRGNPVSGAGVAWSSSADGVAMVDATGTVMGRSPGTATITAASGGRSGTAQVTVTAQPPPPPAPVASVTVTPPTGEVQVGSTLQLTATPRNAAGDALTGRQVAWQSSAPGVAAVDANGRVSGVAPGEATITATSEGKSGTARVVVLAPAPPPPDPVASVSVSPSTGEAQVGETLQLAATPRNAAGAPLTGRQVAWQSSAPGIATVDANGRVTGVAPGEATITATSEGKSGSARITVVPPPPPPPDPVASVGVSPSTGEVQVGGTLQLAATPRNAAGAALAGRVVTWRSSAPGIVTVDANGRVTGVAPGEATVTATSEGKSGTARITVPAPPPPPPAPVATVAVTPPSGEIDVGGTLQLTATPRDAAGNALSGREVRWESSEPGVATVDANGRVTGVGPGTATIRAVSEGKTGGATVTVKAPPPPPAPVATVTVSPDEVEIEEGETVRLRARARDAAGNVLEGRTVRWSSSNTNFATVDADGVVTGVRKGKVTITAEVEGQTGTARVKVERD